MTEQLVESKTLLHEHIGFEEMADGTWSLYLYDRLLVQLDERTWRVTA